MTGVRGQPTRAHVTETSTVPPTILHVEAARLASGGRGDVRGVRRERPGFVSASVGAELEGWTVSESTGAVVVAKGMYGMGGNLAVLADALRLGELMGSPVAVDWAGGMYSVEGRDVFSLLFEQDSFVDLPRVPGIRVWPPQWADYLSETSPKAAPDLQLSRVTATSAEEFGLDVLRGSYDAVVLSRDSANWHAEGGLSEYLRRVQPNSEISGRIDAVGANEGDIGVHVRHGNGERTVVPPSIQDVFRATEQFLIELPDARIFLATDCGAVLDRFIAEFGDDRVFASAKNYPALGSGGMHYADGSAARLQSAKEAIIDIWSLSRCGRLIGAQSFFTGCARRLSTRLNRESMKVIQNEYRSHKPAPGQVPLAPAHPLGAALLEAGIRLDGLFLQSLGEEGELFYLYWPLCRVGDSSALPIQEIRAKLSARRLY